MHSEPQKTDFQHQLFTKKLKFDTKKGVFQHQIFLFRAPASRCTKNGQTQVCTSRAPPPPSTKTWPNVLSQPGAWQHICPIKLAIWWGYSPILRHTHSQKHICRLWIIFGSGKQMPMAFAWGFERVSDVSKAIHPHLLARKRSTGPGAFAWRCLWSSSCQGKKKVFPAICSSNMMSSTSLIRSLLGVP